MGDLLRNCINNGQSYWKVIREKDQISTIESLPGTRGRAEFPCFKVRSRRLLNFLQKTGMSAQSEIYHSNSVHYLMVLNQLTNLIITNLTKFITDHLIDL